MPTARPAIQEPCQSVRTVLPCSVIGLGKPSRVKVSFVQPVRPMTKRASATVIPPARFSRARRDLGLLGPGSALSVVKARAFLGSATTCRANSIAHCPRGFYDPTGLGHLCVDLKSGARS